MKKISNILKRIVVAALIALLAATMPAGKVHATEYVARADIDTSRKGTLTITHESVDKELMKGVKSQIYLVATIDENGQYTITKDFLGAFTDSGFFNNGYNYDAWKSCVQYDQASDSDLLYKYILKNSIQPVTNGKESNSEGKTYYTELALGVYYVHSDQVVKGNFTHSFVNFVYPVPILQQAENSAEFVVNYDPSASPKKSKVENKGDSHCKLRKVWDDEGYANRPSSVTFDIYCDGEPWQRVTLDSNNNWFYQWEKEGTHVYDVVEVGVGDGYTSSISGPYREVDSNDFYYTCVNYRRDNPPPPPDNPPPPPDNPPPPPETPPTTPPPGGVLGAIRDLPQVLGAVRALPQVLGARRLPQTGQLWWPLPILVIAGIFFIVKGIKKNAKMKAQNN